MMLRTRIRHGEFKGWSTDCYGNLWPPPSTYLGSNGGIPLRPDHWQEDLRRAQLADPYFCGELQEIDDD